MNPQIPFYIEQIKLKPQNLVQGQEQQDWQNHLLCLPKHRGAGTGVAGWEPLTKIINYTQASQVRVWDTKQHKCQFQLAVVTCIL